MAYGQGSLFLRGTVYHMQWYEAGRARQATTKETDRRKALAKLNEKLKEAERKTASGGAKLLVKDLLAELLAEYARLGRRSLYDTKIRVEGKLMEHFGQLRAIDVTEADINRFIDKHRGELSNATINRYLAALRTSYSIANRQNLIDSCPHIPSLREDNVRQGFVTQDQYEALRAALPDHLRAVFVVGYHTGARRGELLRIKIADVDFANKEIKIPGRSTKNAKPKTIPIYGDMAAALGMQIAWVRSQWPKCSWLFVWRGKRLLSLTQKAWRTATKAAGLPGLIFHDLRRSAVRNMEQAGIPRSVAMAITGHKREDVYRRYDIVNDRDIQAAASKLEQRMRDHVPAEQPKSKSKLS
jgi:integrase